MQIHILAQVKRELQGSGRLHVLKPVQEPSTRQYKVAASPAAIASVPKLHASLQQAVQPDTAQYHSCQCSLCVQIQHT